jgi:hypothetical protein
MSYDLTFAKPKEEIPQERVNEAYDALRRDEPADFFEPLPVDKILDALCQAYEDFEPAVQFPSIDNGRSSAEVFHSPYRFTFCFRGDSAELQDRIAGIFGGFGCPVYDPQTGKLHALDNFPEKVDLSGWTPPTKAELVAKMAGCSVQPDNFVETLLSVLGAGQAPIQARLEQAQRQRRASNPEWFEAVDKLTAQITRDCQGGRWQRLGVKAETCAAVLHNMTLMGPIEDQQTPDDLVLNAKINLVFLAYLGAIPPGHEHADGKAVARAGAARAIEFCHRAWRDGHKEFPYSEPMSRAQTRAELGWIEPYREGLFLALYVDDESAIGRLLQWPDTDLPIDDGLSNLTAADNYAQIGLAFWLRGEPKDKVAQVVEKLHASKRKRASVFWAALEAIVGKDSPSFAKQMKELCSLYRKSATEGTSLGSTWMGRSFGISRGDRGSPFRNCPRLPWTALCISMNSWAGP